MPTSFHRHFGYSEIRFIAFISLMYEDLENGSNFYQPRTHLRHTPLLTIMSQCMTLENYFLQIAVLSRSKKNSHTLSHLEVFSDLYSGCMWKISL